jgi:hypothetical protein
MAAPKHKQGSRADVHVGQTLVMIHKASFAVQYELNGEPVDRSGLNFTLGEIHKDCPKHSPGSCRLLVFADADVSFREVSDTTRMGMNGGFDDIRVFTCMRGNCYEVQFGEGYKFTDKDPAGDHRKHNRKNVALAQQNDRD